MTKLLDRLIAWLGDEYGCLLLIALGAIVLGVAFVFFAVYYDDVQREADCADICETRGTEKLRITNYGCLCVDGTVIERPGLL